VPVASGVAASWTVASHTGGVESGGLTQTDVWALCATAAGAPPPVPEPGAAGLPASTKPPSITGAARRGSTLTARRGTWTNAPTAYALAWLRCSDNGTSCRTIAGAHGRTYRLTLGDAGARLRVRETASNAAGAGAAAASNASRIVSAGRVTTAQIRADLRRGIVPSARASRIASLLTRTTIVLPFRALRSGRASVSWYRGAPRTLVASGSRTFTGARATTIAVRLTPAGRRALGAAKRVRLTAVGTFTPPGGAPVRVTRTFSATR
jgi:hypothetical protein